MQKKPNFDKMQPRPGQNLNVINDVLKAVDYFDIPVRPAENTLQRISAQELLPPSVATPVPLEVQINPHEPDYVLDQRIEFLDKMRQANDPDAPRGSRTGIPSRKSLTMSEMKLTTILSWMSACGSGWRATLPPSCWPLLIFPCLMLLATKSGPLRA